MAIHSDFLPVVSPVIAQEITGRKKEVLTQEQHQFIDSNEMVCSKRARPGPGIQSAATKEDLNEVMVLLHHL